MSRGMLSACALLIAMGGCSTVPGGTPIPRTEAEKLELGARLATLIYDEKTISDLMDAVSSTSLPSDKALCESAPEAKRPDCLLLMIKARPKLEAVVQEVIDDSKSLMPELMDDTASVMTEIYTPAELAKMVDFYSSPEGQAIMKKQPEVMKRIVPKITARMEPYQIETTKKVLAVLQEAFAEEEAATGEPG